MAERPDLGGGDIFVDFPIIPLLDIINGSDVQLLDPHPPIDYVPYSLILVFPFCPCDLHSFYTQAISSIIHGIGFAFVLSPSP